MARNRFRIACAHDLLRRTVGRRSELVPGRAKWIVFHARPEGQADVFMIPVASGSPKRLTSHPADNTWPNISRGVADSPDGPRCFTAADGHSPDLKLPRSRASKIDRPTDSGRCLLSFAATLRRIALYRLLNFTTGQNIPVALAKVLSTTRGSRPNRAAQ